MEKTSVQKLARVVRVLILIVFAFNLIALLTVPVLTTLLAEGARDLESVKVLLNARFPGQVSFFEALAVMWLFSWRHLAGVIINLFLLACGICTAVILWQAKGVLDNILRAKAFSFDNGKKMKNAAICCFIISAAALIFESIGLGCYNGTMLFLTFGLLLIPMFFIAGLICLVMSALFRQAAELKAENDLTI